MGIIVWNYPGLDQPQVPVVHLGLMLNWSLGVSSTVNPFRVISLTGTYTPTKTLAGTYISSHTLTGN